MIMPKPKPILIMDNPLWDFSLHVYRDATVKDLCLWHQENYNANVNLLLFSTWCAFDEENLLLLKAFTLINDWLLPWHLKVTMNLRKVRKYLRATEPEIKPYCQSIANIEIESEHIQHNMLYQWYSSTTHKQSNPALSTCEKATSNINNYYQSISIEIDDTLIQAYVNAIANSYNQV